MIRPASWYFKLLRNFMKMRKTSLTNKLFVGTLIKTADRGKISDIFSTPFNPVHKALRFFQIKMLPFSLSCNFIAIIAIKIPGYLVGKYCCSDWSSADRVLKLKGQQFCDGHGE